MNFELRFTTEAEETFDALVIQLQQKWGDHFVAKFETRVLKALKTITITPFLYPVAEENTGIRKCILHKNCSLFYKINEENIVIICFWDNRQDPIFS
ncbi:type II toxin-antitoxin system RelE/ParE family toxin [Mucilaginibacter sp.]|uniref:type II toxin-antitoxin system RelE/ParE family toxin n=1 Tax=Mucilaginibacter sp. TaxID=1882438 RepID=UPI00260C9191|nr:type II toxin-antitoxin system RelE/ParE family toxin [Mucilaginibacter sp.]MDB4918193.1 Plasmid stabilization system protein ParE [Mucilaginibacter sp.]